MKKEKRVLVLYLIFVAAVSAVIEAMWIYYGDAGSGFGPVLMFVPMVVAVILKLIFFRKESRLGFRLGKPIYYLFALIIPLGYIGLSYVLYWLFVPGSYAGTDVLVESLSKTIHNQNLFITTAIVFVIGILMSSFLAFGEEVGWRGLMYPTMHKLWGRNRALIVSGVIWALWHLLILVSGNYMSGAPLWYSIPMFIVLICAIAVVGSWLRIKSNSIWPAALWHGMHNFLDQSVFSLMTGDAKKAYFVSETGFITTLCAVMFAVLILVFGKFNKAEA